ncbi:MAG: hypothetical protein COV91_02015 [Candidatus Taylorbacteria bacterium CG11_big_fil_rev_8_21_14_0_20_46_11]|uniref:Glucosamine/galactosamine-6-phosphate isomerase domain-containing protein n=1 Tax=Candidatus Taylorbacteria bacterium CG11_big_fil_rev_8_21_14_0_20_46_11 TaxID=1975025 RepID=A0A2H0KC68_9BACT|nr:MAG: hypothetical protein COV91_02015 [Candidatus Taylorbacteria bacterium CG11_big_fil_rev_8_21_14_0_20_46_11]
MKTIYSSHPRDEATEALKKALRPSSHIPTLFLTSGGSALSLLEAKILPEKPQLTISVLDEHYDRNPLERTSEKLKKLPFYASANQKHVEFFDVYEGEVEKAGIRFDTFLKSWRSMYPKGNIVCTIGIGADGHTMGIMPSTDSVQFAEMFTNPDRLAIGYKTTYGPLPERVTSTFSLLTLCDTVIVFAVGNEKKDVLLDVIEQKELPYICPAVHLNKLDQAVLYTDQEL